MTYIDNTLTYAGWLTEALENLLAARDAVTDQQELIEEFLEDSFANEFVEAATTNRVGAEAEADDVNQVDIGAANDAAAQVMVTAVPALAVDGATFNGLTDAQQEARIASARVDLQAEIDDAQDNVDTAAEELKVGVANLVATAQARADALEVALDAQDAQDTATDEALAAAGAVASTDSTTGNAPVAFADAVTDPAVGKLQASDGTATADITAVSTSGKVSFTSAVALNAAGSAYTITLATGVTTTVSKSYLDAVLVAAQADVNAATNVTSAESALATAVVNVLEAQDPAYDGSGEDYDSLVAADVITVVNNATAADTVTLDYSESGAVGGAAIDTYAGNLVLLSGAQEDLANFNNAVADWEGTDSLASQLAELNEELGDLNDAVVEALAALENDVDGDPAGLGITLREGADNFTVDSDVYLFAEGTDQTLADFGASGQDSIYFGDGFKFVQIAEGKSITDNVGNVNELEILWEQDGDNLVLYVEEEVFAGNSSGTADITTITLTGVSFDDVNIDGAFLVAGTAA